MRRAVKHAASRVNLILGISQNSGVLGAFTCGLHSGYTHKKMRVAHTTIASKKEMINAMVSDVKIDM